MTPSPPHRFETTKWTQVLAARGNSPDARNALRGLCETYYEPVVMFIHRTRDRAASSDARFYGLAFGHADDEAKDLTHEFFTKVLEGGSLDHVDRTRGRFRSYLLGAVKHFLADRSDRVRAMKRGGSKTIQSLTLPGLADELSAAAANEPEDSHGFPPDAFFDRQWGLTLVQQAIDTLRNEAKLQGEQDRFEVLQRWLVKPTTHDVAMEAAGSLGLSEGAFKVAVHRLRKRFRQIVLERISATVEDPIDIPGELNYLIAAVAASSHGTSLFCKGTTK